MTAEELIRDLRQELYDLEQRIRQHPFLVALEAGRVPRERLRRLAGEQYHIIRSDLRSVALLVSRFGSSPSGPFFRATLNGEAAALEALGSFASAIGLDQAGLEAYEPMPGAQAYPAYMAWLALYASDAEVAAGYLVNFAAWGDNCARVSTALRARYDLGPEATRFFDVFASPPPEFEPSALAVVDGGLGAGVDPKLIQRSARLLQGFEKLFWDTVDEAASMSPQGEYRPLFEPLGLDHVVLRVRDQAASKRFYTDVLGAKLDHINVQASLTQLRFGEHLIDLLPGERGSAGVDHVCLSIRSADLSRVRDALTARGVAIEGDVVERRGAYGIGPSLYIRDPDGYLLELKPR